MTVTPLVALQRVSAQTPSMFHARGTGAASIAALGWILIVIASAVFAIIVGLLLYPLWRDRAARRGGDPPPGIFPPRPISETSWLLVGGSAIPGIVLLSVFLLSLRTTAALSHHSGSPALRVDVIGHQWWWEIRYPDQGIVTANEIHVPVGRTVSVSLRSADVIHSFWVPELQGKTDLVPGQDNESWIHAVAAGTYRGQCAEYCGAQHAHMALVVVADEPADFATWLARERLPANTHPDSTTAPGERVFLTASCGYCHTVRGTQAGGTIAPDLTHLASRRTLAAGSLDNTRGNLAAWILNPDVLKPGTKMPPIPLDGTSMEALLAYLESLK